MTVEENQFFFAEFEDILEEEIDTVKEPVHNSDDDSQDEENVVHKLDANSLTLNDLLHEMERRGLQPKGFFSDDAKVLQAELDREHTIYLEKKKRERREAREFEAKQAILLRRKKLVESQILEENEEIKKDPVIKGWLDLIHHNEAPATSRIDLNNITSRSLAKSLWEGTNITCLDISNMELNDLSGAYLCRTLRKNRSIKKVELGGNLFGSITCETLADALRVNNVVQHIGLESNPLMMKKGITAIAKLAETLTYNQTLRYLSLWRCNTGREGGRLFSDAITKNKALICFDLGYNGWYHSDVLKIAQKLVSKIKLSYYF